MSPCCRYILDKPARPSFSCSLDLLLMSIKQIQIEISETAIGCLIYTNVKLSILSKKTTKKRKGPTANPLIEIETPLLSTLHVYHRVLAHQVNAKSWIFQKKAFKTIADQFGRSQNISLSLFIISKIKAPANLCEVSRVDAHGEVDSHEGGGQKNFYLETLLSWYSITKGITTKTLIMRMINVILPVLLSVIPTIFLAINM